MPILADTYTTPIPIIYSAVKVPEIIFYFQFNSIADVISNCRFASKAKPGSSSAKVQSLTDTRSSTLIIEH